jgi:uncharacterized protein
MEKPLPILDPARAPDARLDPSLASEKLASLRVDLAGRIGEGALVAFSGGTDSAFLLWASAEVAAEEGGKVVALTTTSPSTPGRDKEDAAAFARELGVPHRWRESLEVSNPEYARNERDRCYHCKTELFRIAREVAREEGLRWLLYGYNASDHEDDRPGHRAARESGVLAPLSDAGITKAEIRHLMSENGLSLAQKPSSPCLSSRIMTGIPVTPERLRDVEAMESLLRSAGVQTLRVRVCGTGDGSEFLRVEVPPEEMPRVLECRTALQEESHARGYKWLTLDLAGYRTGGGVS